MISEQLPAVFFENMKAVLGDDYGEYASLLDAIPFRGLRVNTLKSDFETVSSALNTNMTKTPFCENGYYISNDLAGLGNHPLHHAGAFYLQEPSAMSAVTALGPRPGDKVLDLCAAPGGKSTQAAALLQNSGILFSNEIVPARAKILCSNIERMGIRNAVVTCAHPEVICKELSGWFDKVLVDAPCSGEGMLRREPAAVKEWKIENHAMCADRSLKILDCAAGALRAGGVMVYSTCTLSAEENEQTIAAFLERHPEFSLCEIDAPFGRAAYPRLCGKDDLRLARRILYQDGGEGHFVAKLQKSDSADTPCGVTVTNGSDPCDLFYQFAAEHFDCKFDRLKLVGDTVYLLPALMPKLDETKVIRAGVCAGTLTKGRFEPSHQLYVSTPHRCHKNLLELEPDSADIRRYLHGEVIPCDTVGYTAVSVCGAVTGFGKASSGQLKNHYPKGLRTLNI